MTKQEAAWAIDLPDAVSFQQQIEWHITYSLGKTLKEASAEDIFSAVSLALRVPIINALQATKERRAGAKEVAYLSMEFLMGRALSSNLLNLGLVEVVKKSVAALGFDLGQIANVEEDAALGNGGLGRLAACFLESLSTLEIPATGYGILYEYGLFKQEIIDGEQRERPDQWKGTQSPWLIERRDEACLVPVYGRIVHEVDAKNEYNPMWMDWRILVGVPYDLPVVGFGGRNVNALRLFSAKASDNFDIKIFNNGDYLRAVEEKISSETVSKVLYPADHIAAGRELRLVQEYFLVACAIRDMVRRLQKEGLSFEDLPTRFAIQLNDTHPALSVAELMRVLVDEGGLPWERSWEITKACLAYTNHTLMAEALESWSVELVEKVLPRHLQIIYEINRRFLDEVSDRWPRDTERLRRMSIIDGSQHIRMAHLAIVGSHSVNGVAAIHSELVKTRLVPDFYEMSPEKFNNKTNGVTPRRWILQANPLLSKFLTQTLGPKWITDLNALQGLEKLADDLEVQNEFMAIKRANKTRLAGIIYSTTGVIVSPDSLFDVQIKRIHEYKRQLLNVLHVLHLYYSITQDGLTLAQPRSFIFAGKAAPGYHQAKRIIHLINAVAKMVNEDRRVKDQLKVVFLPDYRVSLAEQIIPAADLSEQISTAGTEASGTGNMKLSMNGALTIGTLDGANIEIRDAVGPENIFIFGHTVEELDQLHTNGYSPLSVMNADNRVKRVVEALAGDTLCPSQPDAFRVLYERLTSEGDQYAHLADFSSYIKAQEEAADIFQDRRTWVRKTILNVARMGKFSSDNTIAQYAKEIWNVRANPR
jgi:starch phosphorylase